MNWRYRGGMSKVGIVHAKLSLEGEWQVLQPLGQNLVTDVTTTNWQGSQSGPESPVQIQTRLEEDPSLNQKAWRVEVHGDGVVESWRLQSRPDCRGWGIQGGAHYCLGKNMDKVWWYCLTHGCVEVGPPGKVGVEGLGVKVESIRKITSDVSVGLAMWVKTK